MRINSLNGSKALSRRRRATLFLPPSHFHCSDFAPRDINFVARGRHTFLSLKRATSPADSNAGYCAWPGGHDNLICPGGTTYKEI
jgi:hypothetical protein